MKKEIKIVGIILLSIAFICAEILLIGTTNSLSNEELVVEQESEIRIKSNITYELSEINQEVIDTAQKYFTDIDFVGLIISYEDFGWYGSFYWDNGRVIVMGIKDVENNLELYELVLTHEYMHYILYRYNLENHTLHEGLADVYTIFLKREEQGKIFGLKNEERTYPYSIFSNQILEENNFDCLYNVFDENNKINNFEEILIRLEKWCDVSY